MDLILKITHIFEDGQTEDRLYSDKQIYKEDIEFFNNIGAQIVVQWVRERFYTCAYFNLGDDPRRICVKAKIAGFNKVFRDLREIVEEYLGTTKPIESFAKHGEDFEDFIRAIEQEGMPSQSGRLSVIFQELRKDN